MRTSWRRQPTIGSNLTNWQHAYRTQCPSEGSKTYLTECLYEAVDAGVGDTPDEAREDFLENIRLKISELTDMLQYCSQNQPQMRTERR